MPRKGQNIYKRKNGRWEGRYILSHDRAGKAVYKSIYARSYYEVRNRLAQLKTEHSQKNPKISDNFEAYAEQWLLSVKLRCKPSTYNKYKNLYIKYIRPKIGNYRLDMINIYVIEDLLQDTQGLAGKTQNDILCVIKLILRFAEADGNMCRVSLNNLSVRQEIKEMRVLSPDEQKLFSDYLTSSPDLCKLGIFLCLCTGIRIGEICALKRKDISDDDLLNVNKTMQRIQVENRPTKTEIIISEPKSSKSMRRIPIPLFAVNIIRDFYSSMKPEDYILTGRSDKFMEPRALEYRFKKYIKECGLKDVNFHALRHTFATRCIESGTDIKTLSDILGHVNVNITLNRYVHSSMELKRKSMEELSVFF